MAKARRKSVTIRDIADRAGVSTATVSRSLTGKGNVPAATRELVAGLARELGYRHLPAPIRDANGHSARVGVLIPDLLNPFFASMVDSIAEQAERHDFALELAVSRNNPKNDPQLVEHLLASGAAGIIVTPAGNDAPYLRSARQRGVPCLFADRSAGGAENWVVSDDVEGAYQATKYLIGLNHRNILYVGGKRQLSTERDRLAGYKKALAEHGIPLRDALIREIGFDPQSAYSDLGSLPPATPPFTAVLAADDLIAIGAKRALEEKGLSIPGDVSLIGYGDMYFSNFMALSTVSSPSREIGKNAFIMLLDLLHKRVEHPQQLKLRPSLVIRSSCTALRR